MHALAPAIAASLLAIGCSCSETITPDSDGGVLPDAYDLPDSGIPPDADPADAARDGGVPDDAPIDVPDAPPFDCGSCAGPGPCEELICDGACAYVPSPEGTACGEGVCVEAACEARRCGDGWRERGDVLPREGCDDRNTTSGDGCSADCQPEMVVVAENPGGNREWTTAAVPTAAFDDAGNLLVVWARERPDGTDATAVLARRFDRFGAPIDPEPLRIDTVLVGDRPSPSAVGLASGWAMAWSSRTIEGADGSVDGLACAIVPVSGAPGPPFQVNVSELGSQRRPSLARLESGFVVTWEDQSLGPPDVYARLFDPTGTARSTDLHLATTASADARPFAIALGGERWLLAWLEASIDTVILRAQQLEGATAGRSARMAEGPLDELALANDGTTLLLGVRSVLDTGTIGLGTFPIDATKGTMASLGWMGSTREERDVAVAALGGGDWLAVYRTLEIGADPGAIALSAGATAPPDLELLRAALRDALDVERFSIAPASDGWLVGWTARSSDGDAQVRTFRLFP